MECRGGVGECVAMNDNRSAAGAAASENYLTFDDLSDSELSFYMGSLPWSMCHPHLHLVLHGVLQGDRAAAVQRRSAVRHHWQPARHLRRPVDDRHAA